MFYNNEQIREKLASMERGVVYFDFGQGQCAFANDGEFKIYFKHKLSNTTTSLKEAVKYVKIVLS